VISGIEPPPEPPVPAHASQHEEGGLDEVSIEDLSGRAADQQRPINHASNHEVSGIDPVNVDSMPGVLAEPQTPKAHAASHKTGGTDSVSVLELPDVTDLELVARKGAHNGYAGLDSDTLVPVSQLGFPVAPPEEPAYALRFDKFWGPVIPTAHAATHEPGGVDPIDRASITSAIEGLHNFVPGMGLQDLIRLNLTADQAKAGTAGIFDFTGQIIAAAGGGQSVDIALAYQDPVALTTIATLSIPVTGGVTYWLACHLSAGLQTLMVLSGTSHAVRDQPGAPVADVHYMAWSAPGLVAGTGVGYFQVLIGWTAGQPGSTVDIHAATGQGVIRP